MRLVYQYQIETKTLEEKCKDFLEFLFLFFNVPRNKKASARKFPLIDVPIIDRSINRYSERSLTWLMSDSNINIKQGQKLANKNVQISCNFYSYLSIFLVIKSVHLQNFH